VVEEGTEGICRCTCHVELGPLVHARAVANVLELIKTTFSDFVSYLSSAHDRGVLVITHSHLLFALYPERGLPTPDTFTPRHEPRAVAKDETTRTRNH
jgi:hypothetical protein